MNQRWWIPALLMLMIATAPARGWAQSMDSEFLSQIGKAIDKGVVWLKARQIKDGEGKGSWGSGENPLYPGGSGAPHKCEMGITALSLLTLLKCEVDPEDPVIVDGFAYIDKKIDPAWKNAAKSNSTYEAAVLLMAIEAYYDGQWLKEKKAKHDISKNEAPAPKLTPQHDALVKATVAWLVAQQSPNGGWRYGSGFPPPLGAIDDVSATQVVLLGLIAGDRCGAPVDSEVYRKAAKFNLKVQQKDGPPAKANVPVGNGGGAGNVTVAIKEGDMQRGWPYAPGSAEEKDVRITGSMTASGICSQIIAKAMLYKAKKITPTMDKDLQKSIFDGIAWLDGNWTVDSNPFGFRSNYYYLYGIERVGMLGNMDTIGLHNWYYEGAKVLVQAQNADGHWYTKTEVEPGDVLDSCFALLFLKKATMRVTTISRK